MEDPVGQLYAPNQGKQWTPEDREQLEQLFMHGFSLNALCERLGRTPYGILSQLTQLQLVYVSQKDGHYYPYPQEPWVLWQVVRDLSEQYKPNRRNSDV